MRPELLFTVDFFFLTWASNFIALRALFLAHQVYTDVAVFTIYFARCRIKSFSLRACRPVPNRLEKIFFTIKVLGFTLLHFYVEKCPKLERESTQERKWTQDNVKATLRVLLEEKMTARQVSWSNSRSNKKQNIDYSACHICKRTWIKVPFHLNVTLLTLSIIYTIKSTIYVVVWYWTAIFGTLRITTVLLMRVMIKLQRGGYVPSR